MNVEAIIKGRIAEQIVELLLEESDYKVIRMAREGLLMNIARQDVQHIGKSDSAGQVSKAPSFVVIDGESSDLKLIKVRFKGESVRGGNVHYGMSQIEKYWPEALLVVVTLEKPYFQIIGLRNTPVPIEQIFTRIKKESLAKFGKVIKRFLV